jgi:hypothetical protein
VEVVLVLSCPSHRAIVAMSMSPARSYIALVCRSVCGLTGLSFSVGQLAAAVAMCLVSS